MALYAVYAKKKTDKQFKPINDKGLRVTKKDCEVFTSKEEAQSFIDAHKFLPGVSTDIRKIG